jgi:hypothetical protein
MRVIPADSKMKAEREKEIRASDLHQGLTANQRFISFPPAPQDKRPEG